MNALLQRAAELEALVTEHAAGNEERRHLHADVATAMARAGLYRLAVPQHLGGQALPPSGQVRVLEKISEFDGATGWNLMIGVESFGLLASTFPGHAGLFDDPLLIPCGATSAVGSAEPDGDGYRINGRWAFVSGCHNAHVFSATVRRPGDELPVYALVGMDQVEILDTWHVNGMRGSGSHDVVVDNVHVPATDVARARPVDDSPLQRIPVGARLAYNKVGVAMGIARAALDEFVLLATGKTPRFTSSKLRERVIAQQAIAEAEAQLRAARAFLYEQTDALWEVMLSGRQPSAAERALLQLACSHAVAASCEAVHAIEIAAGTSTNNVGSRLERACRDVRVVRQHLTVAQQHIADCGRVLLGLPAQEVMLKM